MGKKVRQIEEVVVVVVVAWHKGYVCKPAAGIGTRSAPEAGLAVGFGVEPEAGVESGAEEYAP